MLVGGKTSSLPSLLQFDGLRDISNNKQEGLKKSLKASRKMMYN